MIDDNVSVKNQYSNWMYKKDYAWNPWTCSPDCDKNFENDKYLKIWTCKLSIIDDLVIKCDKILDMPNTK